MTHAKSPASKADPVWSIKACGKPVRFEAFPSIPQGLSPMMCGKARVARLSEDTRG